MATAQRTAMDKPGWIQRGMRVSVRAEDEHHRELTLEYPFPNKRTGNGAAQLAQRLHLNFREMEAHVCRAIAEGWNPESRGKTFVFHVPKLTRNRDVP